MVEGDKINSKMGGYWLYWERVMEKALAIEKGRMVARDLERLSSLRVEEYVKKFFGLGRKSRLMC